MSGGIKLSPKYGLNPTIPVCFWCGCEKNEIALMGYMSKKKEVRSAWGGTSTTVERDIEAPRYAVINYEPCDKCKAGMSSGFTVMEATTSPNSQTSVEMQKGVYPTGRFVVLKNESADQIFGKEFTSRGKAFMGVEDFCHMFTEVGV